MEKIIIVGASGFGREMIRYIEDINRIKPTWEILGFLDDNPKALDGYKCDYSVIGSIAGWEPKDDEWFVCALAFPEVKKKVITSLLDRGARFATIIHPQSMIDKYAEIGKGVVITSSCVLSSNTVIGDYASILGSSIAHDVSIGRWTTLSGRCSLNGHVTVGESVYMGCGALVAPSKKIGDNATVGIGSVVISNVKPGTTVFGNPAKKVDF